MTHIILLSGGKGTRMKSDLPKVLTQVNGVPIIERLLQAATPLCPKPTLIIGYKGEEVQAATGDRYNYVWQREQLGTGHAVQCAKDSLSKDPSIKTIIVLPGDHPLVTTATIQKVLDAHNAAAATVTIGTTVVDTYTGDQEVFNFYGRVIRNENNRVDRVVEYKDATEAERAVKEVNVSYYCFSADWLWKNIDSLGNNNAAHEFYLTDIVHIARAEGKNIEACILPNPECLGINTKEQLDQVEKAINQA
jgi:UDP-N-acetylglucosamine diphosphorylase/glucosamine-1-phosphate N-acetyltransferase